jgi:hypothetical protein
MKALLVFLTLGLATVSASASGLTCQLLKAQGGRVVAESPVVEVNGSVDITIDTFVASDKVGANISGNLQDELQLSVYDLTSGVSAVTLYSPNNSQNLTVNGVRFALSCQAK